MIYKFEFLEGECFWGGSAIDGKVNPIKATSSEYKVDFRNQCTNQVMPLYMSNKGRYIWSDNPFKMEIVDGVIVIEGQDVNIFNAGTTLKEARTAAMNKHFPCDKRELPMEYFTSVQFNTWMEFIYHPTQEGVLNYAQ